MLSVRVKGQPVGAEVDIRFESGHEARHAFYGSGWSTLQEETEKEWFSKNPAIVCFPRALWTHIMREPRSIVNNPFLQMSIPFL